MTRPLMLIFAKHMPIGIADALVDDWLALFRTIRDDYLNSKQVEFWNAYAEQLAAH